MIDKDLASFLRQHLTTDPNRRVMWTGEDASGTANQIHQSLARIGIYIPAATIRSWAQRRRSRGSIIEPKITAVGIDHLGHAIYLVQDVLDAHAVSQKKRERKVA